MSSSRHGYYSDNTRYILLTYGSTELASLPSYIIECQLRPLAPIVSKGHPHIDIRPRLLHPDGYMSGAPLITTTTASANDRIRRAASAVVRYIEYLTSPTYEYPGQPLSSSTNDNPLSYYLDQLMSSRSGSRDDYKEGGGKLLKGFKAVVHVARSLGCTTLVKLVLEHFLLTYARQIAARTVAGDIEEWRETLLHLGCRSWVRDELEAKLSGSDIGARGGMVLRGARDSGMELDRISPGREGRYLDRFESSLVGRPELQETWKRANSIYALLSTETLQSLLSYADSSLVPPRVMSNGELLDPESELVMIEIRRLQHLQEVGYERPSLGRRSSSRRGEELYSGHGGSGTEMRLGQRIREYLISAAGEVPLDRGARGSSRERW